MVQFQLLFTKLRNFEENGARHLSLMGRHLESGGQTEPVFKLNRTLSEKRRTDEFRFDSGIFDRVIVLTSQVATFTPGQRSRDTES